jgi:hypothetical protein
MRYTAPRILHTQKADAVIRGRGKSNPLAPDHEPPHDIPSTVAAYEADE